MVDNKPASITITGAAKVGETLTATVSDANGVPSNVAHQWMADSAAISGATAKTYALKAAQVGKAITVKASFTDNDGYAESATSAASEAVQPATPVVDATVNNIGVQGAAMFGVGTTDVLPLGMSEMTGTRTVGHENYGNYQHSDGSIMCWIPQFYYRWGHASSPRATKYGLNSLDVKSKHDFADMAAANAVGYALHRAFYDDGQIKDGFFVDKYQASNNAGIASSIKNGIPLSAASTNAPFSGLNGSPSNTLAGAINAVKTRGTEFFVTTLFVQKALSLLSTAHAQGATSDINCAWYGETEQKRHPKGCNNNDLRDESDHTVIYKVAGFLKAGKTGSASSFAKTTHNGQANGVADLNGNMYEVCLGITHHSKKFYALKTTAKAASLTGGNTLASDAWGAKGVSSNYEALGMSIGALSGNRSLNRIGNATNRVFSSSLSGVEWQAACAGIPLATGISSTGAELFGQDGLEDGRAEDMCPLSGGLWSGGADAGVWSTAFIHNQSTTAPYMGFRASLYSV